MRTRPTSHGRWRAAGQERRDRRICRRRRFCCFVGSLMETVTSAREVEATPHASLEALYSISSTINASLDLDVVLRRALETVLEVFAFSGGAIRLLDPPTGELALAAQVGLAPELETELRATLRL